ncbi:MAG: hypothetical protein DMG32_19885 [Acidobacteria bacterium]|nr:MAG: hypothetical protein DMG32_19885 [Acidobacteriota bacterium]
MVSKIRTISIAILPIPGDPRQGAPPAKRLPPAAKLYLQDELSPFNKAAFFAVNNVCGRAVQEVCGPAAKKSNLYFLPQL